MEETTKITPEAYLAYQETLYERKMAQSVLLLEYQDSCDDDENFDFDAIKSVKKWYSLWSLAHKTGRHTWKLHLQLEDTNKDPYLLIIFVPRNSIFIEEARNLIAQANRENYRLGVGYIRNGAIRILQDNFFRQGSKDHEGHRHLKRE